MKILIDFFVDMEKKIIFTIFLSFVLLFQVGTYGVPQASAQNLPDWFKSNAKWWTEGLISDAEIVNALESLIENNVLQLHQWEFSDDLSDIDVPLHEFNLESESSIDVKLSMQQESCTDVPCETIQIPNYIKTSFQYWSDGLISDDDISNSLEYLIKEDIIRSDKIYAKKQFLQNQLSTKSTLDKLIPSDLTKLIFQTHKWNEAAMTSLLKLKDFESNDFKDASQKAWNDYGNNKNSETLIKASTLEESEKRTEIETKQVLKSLNKVKEFSKNALSDAKNSGNSVLDLEDSVYDAIMIIDDDTKIRNQDDYDKVEKNLKKSHNEASDYLQKSIQGILVKDLSPHSTVPDFLFNGVNDIDYSKLSENTVQQAILQTPDDGFGDTNESTLIAIFGSPTLSFTESARLLSQLLDGEALHLDTEPQPVIFRVNLDDLEEFFVPVDDPVGVDIDGTGNTFYKWITAQDSRGRQQVSEVSGLDFLHERIMIGGIGASPDDPPIKPFLEIPVNDYSDAPIDDTLNNFFNAASGDEDDSFRLAVEKILEELDKLDPPKFDPTNFDPPKFDYEPYTLGPVTGFSPNTIHYYSIPLLRMPTVVNDDDTPVVLTPPRLILPPSHIAERPDHSVLDFLHERIVVGGIGASPDDPPIKPIPILIDIPALHLDELEPYFDTWTFTHTLKSNIKNPNDIEKNIPPKTISLTSLQNAESNNFLVKFSTIYNVINSDENNVMENHRLIFEGNNELFLDDPVFLTEITSNEIDLHALLNADPIIQIYLDDSNSDSSEIQTTFVVPYEKYNKESNELFQVGIEIRMSEDIPQEAESLFDEDLLNSYDLYQEIRDGKYHPQVEGAYQYTAPEDSPSDVSPPPGAGSMQQLFPVDTLEIGGLHYPDVQFRVEQAEHCNLNLHYHSHGGPVYSLEGGSYSDPDPNNCGFGLQGGSLGFTTYFASSDQITTWESTTGYDIPEVP